MSDWFAVNARDATWWERPGRGVYCDFEHGTEFEQLGVNVTVLWPGQPMAMYHWEVDQEDFLVVEGRALLVIEDEERPLGQWDFVHCPRGVPHVIVGAGDGPCVIVCVGAREQSTGPDWGAYTVSAVARRHGAGVEQETTQPEDAYARFGEAAESRYRDGWLPR